MGASSPCPFARTTRFRSSAASTRDSRSARLSSATGRSSSSTSKGSREKRLPVLQYMSASTPPRCASSSRRWTRDAKKSWSDVLRVAATQREIRANTKLWKHQLKIPIRKLLVKCMSGSENTRALSRKKKKKKKGVFPQKKKKKKKKKK